LTVADVERDDARGAPHQQNLGKPADRCANVEGLAADDIDAEYVQGMCEFDSSASNVRVVWRDQFYLGLLANWRARLGDNPSVDFDLSSKNQRTGAFARRRKPTVDESHVQTHVTHTHGCQSRSG
jgi:hypothetical protein